MALIKCPECGHEVSDRAVQCPKCAYPIAANRFDGIIRIKLNPIQQNVYTQRVSAKQKVSISMDGSIIWEGNTGEIAEIEIDKPTYIQIQYHTTMSAWGAKCKGMIDPSKGAKYAVQAMHGFAKNSIALQQVDMLV